MILGYSDRADCERAAEVKAIIAWGLATRFQALEIAEVRKEANSRPYGRMKRQKKQGSESVNDEPHSHRGRNTAARGMLRDSSYDLDASPAYRRVRSPAPTWAWSLYLPLPSLWKERNRPPWDSLNGAASSPPVLTEASTWE